MSQHDIQTPERFGGEPLYGNLPLDYRQTVRPFTVTIAGPERREGSRPTTYVVEECSMEKAWAKALAWHITADETIDCYVLADESHEGLPDGERGIHWSDLRAEYRRQEDLDDLADQAAELVHEYEAAVTGRVDTDGQALPGQRGYVDGVVSKYEADAWPMVRRLSGLNGRTELGQ
ncbi:hypothetical protein [Streptomyces canus]|uniref:hypothetical protein n=1 Tax=Streptomyces canus TaxID=58343 RepID=UPI002788E7AE|nr:hypothetical protein [Streptomyces canus]MDQ0762034.1 hypothetical protein [Streptomyces canus]